MSREHDTRASAEPRQEESGPHALDVPSAPEAAAQGALLALQRSAGNRAVTSWLARGGHPLLRQTATKKALDEVDEYIQQRDWARAAWALAKEDEAAIEARVGGMTSSTRQYLVEGARHHEGRGFNTEAVISAVTRVSRRDSIIGTVRFHVWKHNWERAGTYMCGLNDPDIRRVATQLGLTGDDMRAIADAQTDKAQQERLNVAFFTDPAFVARIPKDLVADKDADKLAQTWLAADAIVAPYAARKWSSTAGLKVKVVAGDKWVDFYASRATGRTDPETGRQLTADEARQRAVLSDAFTTETGEVYLKGGENTPGKLIHEAIHALAPDVFDDVLGRAVNEGTTEYFARRVARSAGRHPPRAYLEEHAGVEALAKVVGDALLAESFFTGKTLRLQTAVDDAKGEGKFREWTDAMRDPARRKDAPAVLK